jgi:hypothetical protein
MYLQISFILFFFVVRINLCLVFWNAYKRHKRCWIHTFAGWKMIKIDLCNVYKKKEEENEGTVKTSFMLKNFISACLLFPCPVLRLINIKYITIFLFLLPFVISVSLTHSLRCSNSIINIIIVILYWQADSTVIWYKI